MKNILNIFSIFILVSLPACSNANEEEKKSVKSEEKVILSSEDRALISEYNNISTYLINGDEQKFREELNLFLPRAHQIKNENERNNIIMNIYMQTKKYNEAYDFNQLLMKNNPENLSRNTFQCQLLEIMDKEKLVINSCYEKLAQKIKKTLEQMDKSDPLYLENNFTYYAMSYKSGHQQYKKEMENLINLTSDEDQKSKFKSYFEIIVSD